ncbi:MAG TPA: hypothetical protein VN903_01655 [Polyangia bacterium]|nr:hypothetical protein [Polyangia bacterium]
MTGHRTIVALTAVLLGGCTEQSSAGPGTAVDARATCEVDAERGQCYPLQYVSFNDIPPVGGPSWMCVYDSGTHALVGAWALDHFPRWCCPDAGI